MLRLIEMTASREDSATAWPRCVAARGAIQPEATRAVYAVKRLELPAHSARALKAMSIGYATATAAGSHHDTRRRAYAQAMIGARLTESPNSRCAARTSPRSTTRSCSAASRRARLRVLYRGALRSQVQAVTGWDVTVAELEQIGERVINLRRLFNVREACAARTSVALERVMHEPIPTAPLPHVLPVRRSWDDARPFYALTR